MTLKGIHVLVVEDDDDTRELLKVLLETHGRRRYRDGFRPGSALRLRSIPSACHRRGHRNAELQRLHPHRPRSGAGSESAETSFPLSR